ncbi:MAG: hypothetical protein LAT82_04195 [Nanoarchaeota archaeon]|nr:hypothetical protein [Nanoarchaeota archaeon]
MTLVQELIHKNLIILEQQVKPLLQTEISELSKFLVSDLVIFLNNILSKLKSLKYKSVDDALKTVILIKIKKEILLLENTLINNSNFKNFQTEIILLYLEYQLLNEDLNDSWNFMSEKFKLSEDEQRKIQIIITKLNTSSNISEIESIIDMNTEFYLQSADKRIKKLRIVEQGLIRILKENYRDEFKIYFLSTLGRGRLNFLFSLFNSHYHDNLENFPTNIRHILRGVLICENIEILCQEEIDSLFLKICSLASKSRLYIHFYSKLEHLGPIFRFGKLSNLTYKKLFKILILLDEINKYMKDELFLSFLEFELNEVIQINHLFIKSDEEYQITFISFLELLSKQHFFHLQKLVIRNFLFNKSLLDDSNCITLNSLKIINAKNFADNCQDLDNYTGNIFDNIFKFESEKYILIKSEDIILGHIKLRGIKSFLCYVDVKDSKGNIILLKGLVYGINKRFEDKLFKKSLQIPNNIILAINLNTIKLTPLRLISFDLLSKIDTFIVYLKQIDTYQITTLNEKKFFFYKYFSQDRKNIEEF